MKTHKGLTIKEIIKPFKDLTVKLPKVVVGMFIRLSKEFNQTMLIVTHDQEFAKKTQRIIEMEDGKIIH